MSELESAYAVIENAHGFDDPTSGVGWAWQVVLKNIEQTEEELAAVKAERSRLIRSVKHTIKLFNNVQWGYDGDCGSGRIIENLEYELEQVEGNNP